MKKKIISLLFAILLTLALPLCVTAAEDPLRLWDGAQILTKEESSEITSELNRISTSLGVDVVIVTVPTTEDKSTMEYADDYYDTHGFSDDGVILLVCMDPENRSMWISTAGLCINAINDLNIETIFDLIEFDMQEGYYRDAFKTFCEQCEFYINGEVNGYPPNYFFTALISIGIGIIIALIVTGIMKGQLKSVRANNAAARYVEKSSMKITTSKDLYLYSTVTKIKNPEKSSGSSTHRSSSGRSHGGGGRSF